MQSCYNMQKYEVTGWDMLKYVANLQLLYARNTKHDMHSCYNMQNSWSPGGNLTKGVYEPPGKSMVCRVWLVLKSQNVPEKPNMSKYVANVRTICQSCYKYAEI
jgi:hypothetical protein